MASGKKSIIKRWETHVGIGVAVACFSVLGVFLGLKTGEKESPAPQKVAQVETAPQAEETVEVNEESQLKETSGEEASGPAPAEEQPAAVPDMGEPVREESGPPSGTFYEESGVVEEGESTLVHGPAGPASVPVALEGPPAAAPHTEEAKEDVLEPPTAEDVPENVAANEGRVDANRPRTHTVKPSDTLMGIAKEYYGSVSKWVLIYDANGLSDRDHLVVGQELVIPPSDYVVKQQPVIKKASFHGGGSPGIAHRVQQGDTLKKLARAYYNDESQWKRIYDANKGSFSDGKTLKPGEVLIIP